MNARQFERLTEPNIYGYVARRADGLSVEVVRCYSQQWNLFLTRAGYVVARSLREYRECRDGYLSRKRAFAIARELLKAEVAL